MFCVLFYRIFKYAYLLRHVACLGYKKGLSSVMTMNGVTRQIVLQVLVLSLLCILGWYGVCVRDGGGGGLAFPIGGYGVGRGVGNTQKSHKIQGGAP